MSETIPGRLHGKTAIITGAARGIGLAIATRFAREGCRLGLMDVDSHALKAVTSDLGLGEAGQQLALATVDISDRLQVEEGVAAIIRQLGPPDILINNAGINLFDNPLTLTDDGWARCMAVNLEGAWHMTRAVLPSMIDRGAGSVVNIASTHAFSIIRGCFPYPVAKHGLIGLTRSLAIEYAGSNIRINAIAPGYIETDKVTGWLNEFPDPAAVRQRVLDLIPLHRIGLPEEVANAALFLASDEAAFCTGSILTMDGGRSIVYHD